ncbi:enoyl-CoA hydratase/isomerase family protein [Rhodoferax sp. GW822-FHT02A01]|uniref:enoyl-CoA hydratase/isomerase family protein n=1 Tax=Rhodoferax sp. GW822-FHT02A01 TaxID=3141537 RepID=UPI00315D9626
MQAQESVVFQRLQTVSGHVFGHATLNAPSALNALSIEMVNRLDPQLRAWAEDPSVVGVILDAAGDKAFCAGGDVVALHRAIRAVPLEQIPADAAAFFEREYRLDYLIHTYPKPVLCWGHGTVMGGGIGLMAGASHRVATPGTRLAMPEISLGLYPDVGGSWFLPRAPGKLGMFLALTGAPLNAVDACFAGLADFVLDAGALPAVIEALSHERWQGQCAADAARLSHILDRHNAVDAPVAKAASALGRIDKIIGHDDLMNVADRLKALEGDAEPWLAQSARAFAKGSPTSARLSFIMPQYARHRSLADVFRLEYQASVGCCVHGDFAEGVRALLIDKDKCPAWQPDSLERVTQAHLDSLLRPRFDGAHPLADLA